MQRADSFEFHSIQTKYGLAEEIRIKGHRIAIEDVIDLFNSGSSPERIVQEFYPSLTLAEVYATIAYYLQNKTDVDAYIKRGEKITEAFYQESKEKGPYFLRDEALADARARQEAQAGNGP